MSLSCRFWPTVRRMLSTVCVVVFEYTVCPANDGDPDRVYRHWRLDGSSPSKSIGPRTRDNEIPTTWFD